jgi:hypothetical protein
MIENAKYLLEFEIKLKKSFDGLGVARHDKNNLFALFSKSFESLDAKMKRYKHETYEIFPVQYLRVGSVYS